MISKTCLITGTASGMGKIAAEALAEKGAKLILVDFDTDNGLAARDEIIHNTGNHAIEYIDCDVSSFSQLHRLSGYVHEHYTHLDVLINNAGITESIRRESENGFEMTLATNFLGPFLLTHLLLDLLEQGKSSRIVNISSDGHKMIKKFEFKEMNGEKSWHGINHRVGFQAYARSKVCLNTFSFRLAEQLKKSEIDVYAVSPGYFIDTNVHRHMRGIYGLIVKIIRPFLQSAERGALNHIVMASEEQYHGQTGLYWEHGKTKDASPCSYDPDVIEFVWNYACKAAKIDNYYKEIGQN